MKLRLLAAFSSALFVHPKIAMADEPSFNIPPVTIPESIPKVLNGYPVPGSLWPATRISRTTTSKGTFQCTATIIGPRVVLTAAHCVDNDASMVVKSDFGNVTVRCEHHNSYSGAPYHDNDIALCISPTDISLGGARYEKINTKSSIPQKGAVVRLLGYGCTEPSGETAPYLYSGTTQVVNRGSNKIHLSGGGGAVVCEGDSGGAAYAEGPQSPSPLTRVVIGVNSTREIDFSGSNVTDIADTEISKFIQSWKSKHAVSVCGYDEIPGACHP